MEEGSSSRRFCLWVDEVEGAPGDGLLEWPSEDVLGRGPEGRVALSDSEDYSDSELRSPLLPEEKGKALALGFRRRRARRHRRGRRRDAGSDFDVGQRHSTSLGRRHPASPADVVPWCVDPPPLTFPLRRASPVLHPPCTLGEPDGEGFFQVQQTMRTSILPA
jgi:hypothetical protein